MHTTPSLENRLVISRLAIERCQHKLAHLLALLHLCGLPSGGGAGDATAESMHKIIASMEQELRYSAGILAPPDKN